MFQWRYMNEPIYRLDVIAKEIKKAEPSKKKKSSALTVNKTKILQFKKPLC